MNRGVPSAPAEESEHVPVTRASVRKLLTAKLKTDSDSDAFCIDPVSYTHLDVYKRQLDGQEMATVLDSIAWYSGNSEGRTHPVGRKAANPFGLCDMLGNVWEWCQDLYGPYSTAAQIDPTGPTEGTERVYRGGSGHDRAGNVRAAFRSGVSPGGRSHVLSFRLARGQGEE